MCVIIFAETERPHPSMLEEAWKANDDGAGLAWREKNKAGETEVVWHKGCMDKDEILKLCASVPLPYVVHFRRASVGAKKSYFTQPFETSKRCVSSLTGRTKEGVLFHNGTWRDWAGFGKEAAVRSRNPIPKGKWNDSRCIAWMTAIYGEGFMEFLPDQRGFLFTPTEHTIYWGDGWVRMKDKNDHEFLCSNDRPWTKNYYDYGHHHQYDRRPMCRHSDCWDKDNLDSDFRCPKHPLKPRVDAKKEDKQEPGGASARDPFPPKSPQGKSTLITLETAERLRRTKIKGVRALSKGEYKSIKSLYKKISRGGKRAEWAMNDLLRLSESLHFKGLLK